MPGADVSGGDRRQRVRKPGDREPVPSSPNAGRERELKGIAEHVVRHLLAASATIRPRSRSTVALVEPRHGEDARSSNAAASARCSASTVAAESQPVRGGGWCPSVPPSRSNANASARRVEARPRRAPRLRTVSAPSPACAGRIELDAAAT